MTMFHRYAPGNGHRLRQSSLASGRRTSQRFPTAFSCLKADPVDGLTPLHAPSARRKDIAAMRCRACVHAAHVVAAECAPSARALFPSARRSHAVCPREADGSRVPAFMKGLFRVDMAKGSGGRRAYRKAAENCQEGIAPTRPAALSPCRVMWYPRRQRLKHPALVRIFRVRSNAESP